MPLLSSSGVRRGLLYILIATTMVLIFSFMISPRIHPEKLAENPDQIKSSPLNQPTPLPMPAAAPPTGAPLPSATPLPKPAVAPPTACKPDLSYKPTASNSTTDEYMDLGDNGCYNGVLESNEETLVTEVGCDKARMQFWLMWTTAREDWKLKHYKVIDNIFSLHPNATIHILTQNMTTDDFSFYAPRFKIIHHSLEFDKIFKNTPLERWVNTSMKNPKIANHKNFFSHLTDAMRLALLWKYGGVYMDTDAILLKKIDKIRNTIGYQGGTGNELNGAVLIFDRQHPFLYLAMHSLMRYHLVSQWGSAGPILLTRCVMMWNQLDPMFVRWIPSPFIIGGNISLPNEPLGTPIISVFTDQLQFYPVTWYDKNRADTKENHFGVAKLRDIVEKRTYVYHYFNHMLELWKTPISPGTYLYELMQRGCLLACNNTDVETRIDDIKF